MISHPSDERNPVARTKPSLAANLFYVVLASVVVVGWHALWWLCDDAFIYFRYASNSLLGHGYVWNAPPFRPVEGYTSLLWIALIDLVWRATGIPPPEFVNGLSLLFGCVTLTILARLFREHLLPASYRAYEAWFVCLVLWGVGTNRTFLTWLSSGMETALLNLCIVGWAYSVLRWQRDRASGWLVTACVAASLTELARSDGILHVCGTGLLVLLYVVNLYRRDEAARIPRVLWCAAPLSIAPLHFLVRHLFYGEWLPNPYFAKHLRPWPEAGARYALCFAIEYSLWLWMLAALVWAARSLTRDRRGMLRRLLEHPAGSVIVAVTAGHFLYYTLAIGGDFFEYRVYASLVLFLPGTLVWMLGRIGLQPRRAMACVAVAILASYPVSWTNWYLGQKTRTLLDVFTPLELAPHFPAVLSPYLGLYDETRAWLDRHTIGLSPHAHQMFLDVQLHMYPPRERLEWFLPEPNSVFVQHAVGIPGWVLPRIAIIDTKGLNDWVVARTPANQPNEHRVMAHDRSPPPGYVRCFRPNIGLRNGEMVNLGRGRELTDDEVRWCEEDRWR